MGPVKGECRRPLPTTPVPGPPHRPSPAARRTQMAVRAQLPAGLSGATIGPVFAALRLDRGGGGRGTGDGHTCAAQMVPPAAAGTEDPPGTRRRDESRSPSPQGGSFLAWNLGKGPRRKRYERWDQATPSALPLAMRLWPSDIPRAPRCPSLLVT